MIQFFFNYSINVADLIIWTIIHVALRMSDEFTCEGFGHKLKHAVLNQKNNNKKQTSFTPLSKACPVLTAISDAYQKALFINFWDSWCFK